MADQLRYISYLLSTLYTVALGYTYLYALRLEDPQANPPLSWLHQDTVSSVPHFSALMLVASAIAPTGTFIYIGTTYLVYLAICATMGFKSLATISGMVFGLFWLTRIRPPSDTEIWPPANIEDFPTAGSPAGAESVANGHSDAPEVTSISSPPPPPSVRLESSEQSQELHKDVEEVMKRYSALVDEAESRGKYGALGGKGSPSVQNSPISSANSSLSRRATPIYIGPGMSTLGTRKHSKSRSHVLSGSFIDTSGSSFNPLSANASFASTTTDLDESDIAQGNGLLLNTAELTGIPTK